jgi:2-polyprenyl-6-methoxyphenol hydroxylase-like FAD-dependent oxidoreductase
MTTSTPPHDVVVVGARCAGAATAMLLTRAGHDVVLLDRATFPSDTLSTHSVARGGVVQLHRWGLLDDVLADGAPAVRAVTFGHSGESVTRPVKDRAGVDLLVAPRRVRLDTLLVDAAREAGATVRTGVTALGPVTEHSRVTGVAVREADGREHEVLARYVVAADGRRSRLADQLGARMLEHYPSVTATAYAYVDGVDWTGHEFHVAPGAFAGVFLTHGGQGCVWLCRPAASMRTLRTAASERTAALVAEITDLAPDLGQRAAAGTLTERVRGTAYLPNQVRQAWGAGWALVGDAGYHRDPITGHGITDAFRDAELLAAALDRALATPRDETEALDGYQAGREAGLRETFELTLGLARYPEPTTFVALQKQLSAALEREADALAARPVPSSWAASAA